MKVGFIFDTVLLKKENDFYGLTLNYDFFKNRYLDKTKSLLVIARAIDINLYKGNASGFRKANGEGVEICSIKSYSSIPDSILKHKKIKQDMKKKIISCDKVIIRMPSVLGLFACEICKETHKPYMIEMVACAWNSYFYHTNHFGKLIAPFMYLLTKQKIKKANYVLYVTNHFLQKRYPTKGINFGCSDVILSECDSKVIQKRLDKMSHFNPNNFSVCTVGDVGMKYKGHIYVFQAIRNLKKHNVYVTYYIAGNGNDNYLKDLARKLKIENQIHFLGSLTHEKVFELLDEIEIYIQPSLTEGMPRALIEAMSRGCYCLGSNVGGIPELLQKHNTFRRKSSNQLSKMLLNLNSAQMIENCKYNFQKSKKFNIEHLDKKRYQIYQNFLKNK